MCMPEWGWCSWWLSRNCFWFLFFKGNKTLQLYSFLGVFGTGTVLTTWPPLLLVCRPCFQSPLTSLFSEIPQGLALRLWLSLWRGFWNSIKPDLTANICIMDRRKIKCFPYVKERCGCSSYHLTSDSPALIASPIPCLSSCLAWQVFRGESTAAFLGIDANLLITSGGNSAFSFSFSLH